MKKNIVFLMLSFTTFCYAQNTKLNVYVMLAEDCPISNYMGKPLNLIAQKYAQVVAFNAVFPLTNSTSKTTDDFLKKHQLQKFKIILDSKQMLSKRLGTTITPEAIITDNKGEILYRGRINDIYISPGKRRHEASTHDLDTNIMKALQGESIPQPWKTAIGCYITF